MLGLHLFSLLFVFSLAQAKRCTTPSIRKEWRTLSTDEQAAWISAIKCLGNTPHNDALTPSLNRSLSQIPPMNSSASYYDDLVYVHMDLNLKIHYTGQFLPWHRAYVHAMEDALNAQCGYNGTMPYWDWASDAGDILGSNIWNPDPVSGLGGQGDPDDLYQIVDGGFAEGFPLSYPVPGRVHRNITEQPWVYRGSPFQDHVVAASLSPTKYANVTFSQVEVDTVVNGFAGNFEGFQAYVEFPQGMHNGVHFLLGGDLSGACPANAPGCVPGPKWSPNDPFFFLHHAMIDKIWWDWQNRRPENFWSFTGGSNTPLATPETYEEFPNGLPPFMTLNTTLPSDGMYPELTVFDVLDTTGGELCYLYE